MEHFRSMKGPASMSLAVLLPLLPMLPQEAKAQVSDDALDPPASDGSQQLVAEGEDPANPEGALEEGTHVKGRPQEMPPEVVALFQRGLIQLGDEQWIDARDTFLSARALWDRPNVVFYLALALYHGSEFLAAEQAFEDFDGMAKPSNPDRAEAARFSGLASAAIATVFVSVEPVDAVLWIDGVRQLGTGAERTVRLDPGQHDMRVEMRDYAPYTGELDLAPGEILDRAVQLVATAVAEPVAAPVAEALPVGPALMVGGGATLLAAAVMTGILTGSAEDELEDECTALGMADAFVCGSRLGRTKDNGKNLQVATNVLVVLGSAAALAGGIWWLLSPGDADEPPPASLACGTDGCHAFVRGEF